MKTLTEEADDLLLHQFAHSKRLKGLIRALVTPFEKAYTELEKLHHGHYIDNAQDETLDVIGAIVGQQRFGMSDDDYRPWLKVAICLNNSAGTAEQIFTIIGILYGRPAPVIIQEYPPNAVQFILDHPHFPPETIKAIIRRAVPVTTHCDFAFKLPVSSNVDGTHSVGINRVAAAESATFQFDLTPFDNSYFMDFS